MMTRWIFLTALAVLILGAPSWGPRTAFASTVPVSPAVNEEILGRFEKDVDDLAGELKRQAASRKDLERKGDQLQANAEELRHDTQTRPNMLKEARLRALLGDLKSNLDRRAEEGRREEEQHRTFEEQVLSLAVLYNDRIENLLKEVEKDGPKVRSEKRTLELLEVIGRRDVLQRKAENLRLGARQTGVDRYPPLDHLATMDHGDILLAKGFLMDREAQLTEQIERTQLEEMEIHRQIKLESRVRTLLGMTRPFLTGSLMAENGWRVLVQSGEQEKARLLYLGRELTHYRALSYKTGRYLRIVEHSLQEPREPLSVKPPTSM